MYEESYDEGDYITIYDRQKANTTISMGGEIKEGILVQVKLKRAGMLLCEKTEPTEQVEVKPFPPSFGSSFVLQPGETVSQARSEKKVLDENSEDVSSDVADFLSNDRESKSNILK